MRLARSQLISILIHAAAIVLLLAVTAQWNIVKPSKEAPRQTVILYAPPLRDLARSATPAGGGSQTPSPPRKGELPQSAHRTFILPVSRTVPDPNLAMVSTIDAPNIVTSNGPPGVPSGVLNGVGLGPGREGIGIGCCGGAGDDRGGRDGITGRAGQPTTQALLIHKVEPDFSEEARKARFSGVVLLYIEIGVDGKPVNMRVARALGLGLDEKAMEAVAQWRFRPASKAGKAVVSSAVVQVSFHLL